MGDWELREKKWEMIFVQRLDFFFEKGKQKKELCYRESFLFSLFAAVPFDSNVMPLLLGQWILGTIRD